MNTARPVSQSNFITAPFQVAKKAAATFLNYACNRVQGLFFSAIATAIDYQYRNNPKISAEIAQLDRTIHELATSPDRLDELLCLIPETKPADMSKGMCWEERLYIGSGTQAVLATSQELRRQLLEALKVHRVSTVSLELGATHYPHLVQMKSELMRLHDLLRTGARRLDSTPFNAMHPVNKTAWQAPGAPLSYFPEEYFFLRYPVDTGENNCHAVVRTDGTRLYKTDTSWADTLRFTEENHFERPMNTYSAKELYDLFIELRDKIGLGIRGKEFILSQDIAVATPRASIQAAFHRWGGVFHLAARAFSAADWELLSQDNFVAPPPGKIGELLQQFFDRLQLLLQNETLHPFEIASFIHWALTRIRPLHDGNGSLIRLFMNIFLMQNGFQPLIVQQNDVYLKTFSAANYTQAFGDFLNANITRAPEICVRARKNW